jgi:5-methylcytosine-specific restriction endonuclease McrA
MIEFDPQKHMIGTLCKKQPVLHNYQQTGTSVRRKAHWKTVKGERKPAPGECLLCEQARQAKEYLANKDKINARHKQWHEENKEKFVAYQKEWARNNPEKIAKNRKKYVDKNREEINKRQREFCKTPEGAMQRREYEARVRARERNLKIERIYQKDLQAMFAHFDHSCAYCGATEHLTLDHYIPLKQNGAHALENIIPACRSCNSRKNRTLPDIWYPKQTYYSEDRHQIIEAYLNILKTLRLSRPSKGKPTNRKSDKSCSNP